MPSSYRLPADEGFKSLAPFNLMKLAPLNQTLTPCKVWRRRAGLILPRCTLAEQPATCPVEPGRSIRIRALDGCAKVVSDRVQSKGARMRGAPREDSISAWTESNPRARDGVLPKEV